MSASFFFLWKLFSRSSSSLSMWCPDIWHLVCPPNQPGSSTYSVHGSQAISVLVLPFSSSEELLSSVRRSCVSVPTSAPISVLRFVATPSVFFLWFCTCNRFPLYIQTILETLNGVRGRSESYGAALHRSVIQAKPLRNNDSGVFYCAVIKVCVGCDSFHWQLLTSAGPTNCLEPVVPSTEGSCLKQCGQRCAGSLHSFVPSIYSGIFSWSQQVWGRTHTHTHARKPHLRVIEILRSSWVRLHHFCLPLQTFNRKLYQFKSGVPTWEVENIFEALNCSCCSVLWKVGWLTLVSLSTFVLSIPMNDWRLKKKSFFFFLWTATACVCWC